MKRDDDRTGRGEARLRVVSESAPSYDDFAAVHGTRLMRVAYLLTGNPHDAADLTQDTLERLFTSWWRVRDSPFSYAHRTMVNLLHDKRRWQARHPEAVLDDAGEVPTPRDSASDVVEHQTIIAALALLPPRQRAVIVLRYFEDLSEADIARALDVSVGTVKTQASRGLARLREVVDPPDPLRVDEPEHQRIQSGGSR